MKLIKFILRLVIICIVIFALLSFIPNEGVSNFVDTITNIFNPETDQGVSGVSEDPSSLLGKWSSDEQKVSVEFVNNSKAKITFTDIIPLPISFDYTLEDPQTIRGVISESVASLAKSYLNEDSSLTQMLNDDGTIYFSYSIDQDQLTMTEKNTGTVFSLKRTD